jgi:hypothetical protein
LGLSITLVGGEVVWLGMLGFVDDKCLLSTSSSEMQDMLDVAVAVSRTQRSVYSLPKSVLVQFVGSHSWAGGYLAFCKIVCMVIIYLVPLTLRRCR